MSLALYVHFPFCLSVCPYCDFDRQATGFDRVDAYLEAVVRELADYTAVHEPVHSVFFGGGTPSLMRPDQVARVLDAVRATLGILPHAEVTLEANPGDASLDKMRGLRAAGVNRLSIGVQSLDDGALRLLGRRHTADEARQAARWARTAGFSVSLDLMYGLPGQTVSDWGGTLRQAFDLEPDHLSCYMLTLDERVPMGRAVARGRLCLPVDDDVADMYDLTREWLAASGYEQYEISNWARPGHASRHNLTYWRDGPWIGLGAGAASSFAGTRWKNTPVLERYIASIVATGRAARVEDEAPDLPTRMQDFLALGLRLREGVNLAEFRRRFESDLAEVLGAELDGLLEVRLLERAGDGLRIAPGRQLIANELLVRLADSIRRSAAGAHQPGPGRRAGASAQVAVGAPG